jgi:glycosyltransferase involved in cell wall biosynthesis
MSRSLVSVVMTVYNEEKYLESSIESILNQTFRDFEFVIVNDGSTDRSQEILEELERRNERIRLNPNPINLGIAKSTNNGIKIANGKYIAIMDAGDLSNPDRLLKQVRYLESRNEPLILGTQGRWIDKEGKTIGRWKLPMKIDARTLYRTGGAIHPSIMARKDVFDIAGLYDEDLVMSQEFDFYMRVLKNHLAIENLEDELISIREREEGMTLEHLKIIQKNQLKIKIRYLPSFLDVWNIFYTLRSLAGYLIPSFILASIIKKYRRISQ